MPVPLLRMAVPMRHCPPAPAPDGSHLIYFNNGVKNLVICPLHHDEDFMQVFYEGWRIVQAFLAADANVPKEVALPRPADREVARVLAERREFPLVDVVEAIEAFAQPELLETQDKQVGARVLSGAASTDMVIAPLSRGPDLFD
jgi:hypothetical protein